MRFSDKMYNTLKWIAIIAIPALNTFLLAALPVMGIEGEVITMLVTVISAVATFIGTLIGISNAQYTAEREK